MSWQSKLRLLISSTTDGKFGDEWIGFKIYPPLKPDEISKLSNERGIEIPDLLRDLYTITNGTLIAEDFRIAGLDATRNEQLGTLNDELLSYIRDSHEDHVIQLIIGSDGSTGDLLCLTDLGWVVAIDMRNPRIARILSNSLDSFFDDLCLGTGYLAYDPSGDTWASVLRRMGFLDRS